jgi:hypothetical protein
MAGKREHKRLVLDDSSILRFRGKTCYLIDASRVGLGITFISDEDWPENMTLEYVLPQGSVQGGAVRCLTVWESRMDFFKLGCWETVRRRGLKFLDPESGNADMIYRYSLTKADENR